MILLPREPTPEMCLAGSKERLAGNIYRAMVAAYETSRANRYEAALREIAERDPRTSYITYRNIAKEALGERNV